VFLLEYYKKLVCNVAYEFFKDVFKEASVIGLGTGSTVRYFIDLLVQNSMLKEKIVFSSSTSTHNYLASMGIESRLAPEASSQIDVYIDGFDEASIRMDLVKGRGGAFNWEKILASRSKLRIYVGDYSKFNGKDYLYLKPIPIEVKPNKLMSVYNYFKDRGFNPVIRMDSKSSYVVTDSGNNIIDIKPGVILDPEAFDKELRIDGVVETGIFINKLVDYILISGPEKGLVRVMCRRM